MVEGTLCIQRTEDIILLEQKFEMKSNKKIKAPNSGSMSKEYNLRHIMQDAKAQCLHSPSIARLLS